MFKHGDSKGANAGKKIREGIRAKACTSVRTFTSAGGNARQGLTSYYI